MKKLVLACAFVVSTLAQAAPALPDNNFVYVIGHGEVSVPPDRARIKVTVRASGPDHQRAFGQLQTDSKAVIAEALTLGVSEKDIDAHRIGKSYREPTDKGVSLPELEQTVEFELRDLDRAVALADRVMKLQSVHEVSTSFYVKDPKVAQGKAMAEAAADAQRRAQELAKLFGRKAGRATALAVEHDGDMRARFGASSAMRAFSVMESRSDESGYRVPNAIDFTAEVYVVYALE